MMKTFLVITSIVIAVLDGAIAQEAYPTNFNSLSLEEANEKPNRWAGKIVAFDCEVISLQTANDKPYFMAKLDDNHHLWVASLFTSGLEIENKGLRILGYFSIIKKGDSSKSFNDYGFHVLAFAILDLNTNQIAILPGTESQIKEWENGKVPHSE